MSSALYALGRFAARAKWWVLTAWLLVLILLGAGAGLFAKGANAPITIPGTESQAALETLRATFPQVSGTSAQIIVVAPEGHKISDADFKLAIEDAAEAIEPLPQVMIVQHPFAELAGGGMSNDEQAALLTIQIDATLDSVSAELEAGIHASADAMLASLPDGSKVSVGGEMYSTAVPAISPTEAIGVLVAFTVLIMTLGSLIAAGLPLIIALVGVGVSIAGLFFITAFVELTSTTPMLALMLGLAVGIDYTLFIVSRHQEQLKQGVPVTESIARATATSGSAVVFAGLTVVIALIGLSVARIPFLTALGVAAAAAVAIAVVIAITLTPAILAMVGERVLSKRARKRIAVEKGTELKKSRSEKFFGSWVKIAMAKPLITSLVVLIGLGAAAIPALDLRLALPNASGLAEDDPARITYELTAEHFGEGANGPLVLAGSIITSTDPLGLMDDLAAEVRAIPGVKDVPLATPNEGADTGIIQVIPEGGPHAESTAVLVEELRAHHDEWLEKYGVSLAVTGFTAVGIDVSRLLFEALIPFSILVVGLSLILLAMVFRSVWVPIKATLGYLLSVAVAFGAVVAVFQWGFLAELLNVHATGPVLSFMPIILMGVLFGLAMDYEVFLVARIREEVVHGSDPLSAIKRGFVGSGKVVSAAAVIMFAVFVAFVPEGDPSIKVIALGLAVGVFVDAFIVRMILVPAVLTLLGKHAWWMPRWLDRILPHFDVEGEALAREKEYADWPADAPSALIAADELQLFKDSEKLSLRVLPGDALLLSETAAESQALAEVFAGRAPFVNGTVKVSGLLLPDRSGTLRARSAFATPASLRVAIKERPDVLILRGFNGVLTLETMRQVKGALAAWQSDRRAATERDPLLIVVSSHPSIKEILPASFNFVTLQELEGVQK